MNLKIVLNQEFLFEPPQNLQIKPPKKILVKFSNPRISFDHPRSRETLGYCTWDLKMLGRVCWVQGKRGHPYSGPFLQVISLEILSPFILSWFKFITMIMMFICSKEGCKRSLKKLILTESRFGGWDTALHCKEIFFNTNKMRLRITANVIILDGFRKLCLTFKNL